ncbi:unnamed protein product [Effrenium voratum]|uniref:Uncharacterized protein n=1 Tax=Effrenium voratum TaxID=2562239 RepID=A0AA36JQF7_9DINO|nr:unnamed protein product [Effrenium voratum]
MCSFLCYFGTLGCAVVLATGLKTTANKFYAGTWTCKFPVARSDFSVLEKGEKFVNEAAQIAAGCILQVDNCTLLKRGENNIEVRSFALWTRAVELPSLCLGALRLAQEVEVATNTAWLVSVVGDPVYIPCKHCGTKVNPDTGKCKRADAAACASEPDSAARMLAAAHIADWSGQVENVLIGSEHLAVLAKVGDEQQVAKLIEEKGAQVGEPSATVTPLDATQALTATQQSTTMVKKVVRIDKQRPEGAVLPVRDLYKDITCSDLGTFFQRGSVFASYIATRAYAQDKPDINEVDIQGL